MRIEELFPEAAEYPQHLKDLLAWWVSACDEAWPKNWKPERKEQAP